MHVLRCSVAIENPTGIVTQLVPPLHIGCKPKQRTLLVNGSGQLLTVHGADSHRGIEISLLLDLFGPPDQFNNGAAASSVTGQVRGPIWDAFTGSLFLIRGHAIYRIDSNHFITLVAGQEREAGTGDGHGASARFTNLTSIVSDGSGHLYAADDRRIRRIRLPLGWHASPEQVNSSPFQHPPSYHQRRPPAAAGTTPLTPVSPAAATSAWLQLVPATSPGPVHEPEPLVSTLPLEAESEITGLAYTPARCAPSSACGPLAAHVSPALPSNRTAAAHRHLGGSDHIVSAAADPAASATAGGALLFTTATAVYLLNSGAAASSAPSARRAAGTSLALALSWTPSTPRNARSDPAEPVLLAGCEGARGFLDGPGPDARFRDITGLVVDRDGAAFVVDYGILHDSSAVRCIACGVGGGRDAAAVTTVTDGLPNRLARPAILPNGYLALCDQWSDVLQLLDLGLRPVPPHGPALPARLPARSLAADLGELLDRQPDGTADLAVVVAGGRRFLAHRGILAARCDYFRRCLGAGAASLGPGGVGGAAVGAVAGAYGGGDGVVSSSRQQQRLQQLSLPDADPEAFAQVLRFIYTGRVASCLPGPLTRSVAELADRLLLPELCREAQARVLADVTAESVVDCLLWAESRGGSFADLLADLKAWYLGHHEEVAARAPGSLKRLMAENPDLIMELHFTSKRLRGT